MNRVLDDLIASAKTIADKAGKVADKAGKAADKAVEYSKLKYQNIQLASDLKELYEKLGNAVYTMVKSDFDNKDLMDSIIAEIDHVKETLQDNNVQMAKYKNSVICSACGAICDKDACYCSKCGNKFEEPAEEECCEEEAECCCESAEEETAECTCCSDDAEEKCCCEEAKAEENCCCEEAKTEENCCCCEETKAE